MRIEKEAKLRRIELAIFLNAGCRFDAIGVVQQNAEITNSSDSGLRAHRRLAGFDTRIADDTLLRFS
jgi:hypothetical protein